jgi:signal transduction histidine kinase
MMMDGSIPTEGPPVLRAVGLCKSFGSLVALSDVGFDVRPGHVVGLAGHEGAGKSVLVRILSGIEALDSGEIWYGGEKQKWPFNARGLGVETIFQEAQLIETQDICQNIFVGARFPSPIVAGWRVALPQEQIENRVEAVLAELGFEVGSVRERVTGLSGEQRQLVAIARAALQPARLVIIDDPAPLYSYPYQQKLLSLIERWQQQGAAILFSSHNLDDLFAVTDRILVLRDGRLVLSVNTDATNHEEVVNAIIGTAGRQHLTPVIWALDSYHEARRQAEELRRNAAAMSQDLAAHASANRRLLDTLNEQVRALDRANLAFQDAQRRLLTEREEERKHLARELHDESLQDLVMVSYRLEQLEAEQADASPIQEELAEIRDDVRELVENLRQICSLLRPPTIDDLGLGVAIKSLGHDWSRRTGIALTLELDDELQRLPEWIELSVFRIVQESLNNVVKHSGASVAQLCLRRMSPRMLLVSVSDNGCGLTEDFDLSALSAEKHYGLLGISERIALLGGRMRLQNQTGGGLRMEVEIPHPRLTPPQFEPSTRPGAAVRE